MKHALTAGEADMSELLGSIRDSLSALGAGNTLGAMLALVAAGTIAMAVLQVIKELTPIRLAFQRCWVCSWIAERCQRFNAERDAEPDEPPPPTSAIARWQLAELATGREERAFYDLPVEDLVTQANAAAQIALDQPARYWTLLAVLSEGTSRADLRTLLIGQPTTGSTQPYFDARSRIARRIQRNLDGVRIACGNRWKFLMLLASLVLTTAIVETAVAIHTEDFQACLLALPIGIVGGYLAPIARDLLAALQKLRNP